MGTEVGRLIRNSTTNVLKTSIIPTTVLTQEIQEGRIPWIALFQGKPSICGLCAVFRGWSLSSTIFLFFSICFSG